MRLRLLTVLISVALACAGLTACRTNVGVAANVDGHKITESEVQKYVTDVGPEPSISAQAAAAGQAIQPRAIVANTLINVALYEAALRRVLRNKGGVPSDEELGKLHDEAANRILQTTVTGKALESALLKQTDQYGLARAFVGAFIRKIELQDAFINAIGATSQQQVAAQIAKLKIPLSVNPRYGTWDKATLSLSSTSDDGIPPVLRRLSPAPAQAATGNQ